MNLLKRRRATFRPLHQPVSNVTSEDNLAPETRLRRKHVRESAQTIWLRPKAATALLSVPGNWKLSLQRRMKIYHIRGAFRSPFENPPPSEKEPRPVSECGHLCRLFNWVKLVLVYLNIAHMMRLYPLRG